MEPEHREAALDRGGAQGDAAQRPAELAATPGPEQGAAVAAPVGQDANSVGQGEGWGRGGDRAAGGEQREERASEWVHDVLQSRSERGLWVARLDRRTAGKF